MLLSFRVAAMLLDMNMSGRHELNINNGSLRELLDSLVTDGYDRYNIQLTASPLDIDSTRLFSLDDVYHAEHMVAKAHIDSVLVRTFYLIRGCLFLDGIREARFIVSEGGAGDVLVTQVEITNDAQSLVKEFWEAVSRNSQKLPMVFVCEPPP